MPAHVLSTEQQHIREAKALARARVEAAQKHHHDSQTTQERLLTLVDQHCEGKRPYEWQLDATKALLLGVDSIVVAGTGMGKTLLFVMPLLFNPKCHMLIISPLKALQQDQWQRFQKMGISAIGINGETWSPKIKQYFKYHKYQAILIGPEMCLEHKGFCEILKAPNFSQDLVGIVVDKAHCMSQWGGDFHPTYRKLGDLCSYMPTNIPILATSATLAPTAMQEVQQKLHMASANLLFLNLGNDRPNITPSVIKIKSASDYSTLLSLIRPDITGPEELPKTIIFTKSMQKTLETLRFLHDNLLDSCKPYLDIFHVLCNANSKMEVLDRFQQSHMKIFIATEVAGMGANIPDIELVIQFGVPSSLEVWKQQAG
ncbi:P-loop containing nucleoside triphosphate hydrolase protein [Scleroderma citrinum]